MIEFGNITGGCGGCSARTIHSVCAWTFRFGWTPRLLWQAILEAAPTRGYGTATTGFEDPTANYNGLFNYSTLTISGLVETPSANGDHVVNTDTDAGFDITLPSVWEDELHSDPALGKFEIVSWTVSSVTLRIWRYAFVDGSLVWVVDATVTMTLSGQQTDEDAIEACDTILDAIDFTDVLLFDSAHNAQYQFFKCPGYLVGASWYDSYCNGTTFSAASAGDLMCISLGGQPSQDNIARIALGGGTRGIFPNILQYGLVTYRNRVRVHNPISYSESLFMLPDVQVTMQSVDGPYVQDLSQRPTIEVWENYGNHWPEGENIERAEDTPWVTVGSPSCTDTTVTTSAQPYIEFIGPDPTATSNSTNPEGYAASVARVLRMGITCAGNTP